MSSPECRMQMTKMGSRPPAQEAIKRAYPLREKAMLHMQRWHRSGIWGWWSKLSGGGATARRAGNAGPKLTPGDEAVGVRLAFPVISAVLGTFVKPPESAVYTGTPHIGCAYVTASYSQRSILC